MDSDPILNDKRFAKLATEKKFRSVGKKHKKVKIDKRFQSLFTNDKFSSKCSVDKRGRPKSLSARESFEKFYRLDESDSDSENSEKSSDEDEDEHLQEDKSEEDSAGEEEKEAEVDQDDSGIEQSIKSKLHSEIDYARGEGALYSDSSSEEEEEAEDVKEGDEGGSTEYFDKWGELDCEAPRTEEESSRLAVCNMDWDRVGSEDLFLLLSSFCPSSGGVTSVNLYLSDFGRERLEEEKNIGPRELRRLKGEEEEDEDEDNSDGEDDLVVKDKKTLIKEQSEAMERVRQYQVNRLKYYYAIVEFDSVETASKVYEECDGMEYELSATRLDLRFVEPDMTFSSPQSSCLHHPDPDNYQPKLFFTTALQQGKVELTWDEEDQDRLKSMKEAFDKVDNEEDFGDMSNLIGSGSESEEEAEDKDDVVEDDDNEKDTISQYKALLTGFAEKESNSTAEMGNMEFTWKDEVQVPEENEEENLTPWEKFLKKKKDKKMNRKNQKQAEIKGDSDDDIPDDVDMSDPFFAEEFGEDYIKDNKQKKKKMKKQIDEQDEEDDDRGDLGLMVMDSDDEKEHFDFKHILEAENKEGKKKKKKWRKKKKELDIPTQDSFSVNVADSRFSAMYSRPEFNIDPTNPNFKKTKNMEKIIGEKQKRVGRSNPVEIGGVRSKKQKLEPDVSQAIKSVKNKWKKNSMKSRKLSFKVKDS